MNLLSIILLVLIAVLSGPCVATLRHTAVRRSIGWTILITLTALAHFIMLDESPLYRMIGLCCVLLGAMKALVYAEWSTHQRLTITRYLIFALLWFGMDPDSFVKRRAHLGWKRDLSVGVILMIIGTVIAWLVWKLEWRQVFLMFLPMSIGFHFGALRVLKAIHRCWGFPVRTLFPNPLATTGIMDFWSKRWNVGYSQMMQRVVGRPLAARFGANIGTLAIFIFSGVLHEIAITLPCQSHFGWPTLYFTLHGLLHLTEKTFRFRFGKIPTLMAVILPMPLLFPPAFQIEVIEVCLGLVF